MMMEAIGKSKLKIKKSPHVPTPSRMADSKFGKETQEESWAGGVAEKFAPKDPWFMRAYWSLSNYFNPKRW